MSTNPLELVLSKLPSARPTGDGQWAAKCPSHDDHRASLSVGVGEDGRALIRCFKGCKATDIVAALGLKMRDLMPKRGGAALTRTVAKPKPTFSTAREAVARLESRHGLRSASWPYTDADGSPEGVILRWDLAGGDKKILPVSRNGAGWSPCGMASPRPLFRLPELAAASCIFVCEGEKCVDAAVSIGLTATTSAHGSQSAGKTDWSPLSGKECIILPDADEPGRKYAASVANLLRKLEPRPSIKIVELPGLSEGGDLVNWLDDGHTREELLELVERAAEWAPSTNIREDSGSAIRADTKSSTDKTPRAKQKQNRPQVPAFQPFPVDVLPEPLRGFVSVSSSAIGCDPSYVALPLLAGLAAAIGNTHRIQLKHGWPEPAVLWCVIVGESGTLKSPAIDAALQSIRERQAKSQGEFEKAMEEYERTLEIYKADKQLWMKKGRKNGEPEPLPPDKPNSGRCWCSDTTVEALARLLADAPRGLLLIRDELSGFLRSFDQYKSTKGADVAHFLEMHRAGHLLVDRKTGDRTTISVPHAAVSIAGGVQPETLSRALGVENFENGLAARLLMTMPPRRTRRWCDTVVDKALEESLRTVFDWLFSLDARTDEEGEPWPTVIPLSQAGKRAWIRFYNQHASVQVDFVGALSACWSKLEGYAARLALVIHLVRCATGVSRLGDPVDESSISVGGRLARWFGHEAQRVYRVLMESDEDREFRQLVEMIRHRGGRISIRDYQRCRSYPSSDDAEAELAKLVEAGIGQWEAASPGPRGGRPSKCLVLTDTTDTDNTPTHDPDNGGFVSVSSVSGDDDADWGEV